jgi:hypothetical protein
MIARQIQLDRIQNTTIYLTVALAALSFVTGVGDALSIAFGGAVSYVNLRLIRMLVSRLMSPGVAGKSFSQLVTIKLLLLLALLAVAAHRRGLVSDRRRRALRGHRARSARTR